MGVLNVKITIRIPSPFRGAKIWNSIPEVLRKLIKHRLKKKITD